MTVLIRTFPPSSNPNYGGILQAWALQRALAELGIRALVDSSRAVANPNVAFRVKRLVKHGLTAVGSMKYFSDPYISGRHINELIFAFPDEEIEQVQLFKKDGAVDVSVDSSISGFIVGSDQVWRPGYVDVPSYLLNFLTYDDTRPRVAYAASFGVADAAGYTAGLVKQTRPLAQRFTATSVREDSGRALAQELWGIDATQLVDPTMLIAPAEYQLLIQKRSGQSQRRSSNTYIASYVLDSDLSNAAMVKSLGASLDAEVKELYRPLPRSRAVYRRSPSTFQRLAVEDWLKAIVEADAVVTDSFHGVVFSILFNRPFLVKVNHRRGAARFDSLLAKFGLEDRVSRGDNEDSERMKSSIDWARVNGLVAEERARALAFLKKSLSATPSGACGRSITR